MKNKGQSLVELGISFVFIMFLLSGLVEFGIIFFQYVQLRDAAQEGALYGSIYPDDTVSIEERVRGASTNPIDLNSPDVDVLISFENDTRCEADGIQISVQYPHKIAMPLLPQILGTNVILIRGNVTDTVLRPVCS